MRLLRSTTETFAASLCLRTFDSASWTTRKSTIFCESLRLGQVALDLKLRFDAGRALERAQLGLDRVRDRPGDGRRRADGVRDLAQALVERAEPGVDVVEASAHALPEVVGDDRRDLRRRVPQLLGQRHDLLQRPVVEVEAEAQEAPLAGSHEIVLALHSPVEERGALEERRERGRRLLEILLEVLRLGAASAGDERGVRPVPPLDDPDVHLGRAGDHAVERGLRHLPQAAAARRLAVRDETGGRAGGVENPERAGRGGCELDEQRERELRGDGRRKLRELLAGERAPEDREGRSLRRQPELVGRGRDRGPCLARLEPVLDRDRDDRVAEKVERSSLTPAVGQAPRTHLAGTERRHAGRAEGALRPRTAACRRRSPPHGRSAPRSGWHRPARRPRSAAASTVSTTPFCVQ